MMISILYSDKSYGGAEIYVRKLKDSFNIDFYSIKNRSIFKIIHLCFSENSIVFHDIRASLLKFIRPFNSDKIVIHGPGKNPRLIKIIIKLLLFTRSEVIMVSKDLYSNFNYSKKICLLENHSSFDNINLNLTSFDFVYFGRLESSKGCDSLINFWLREKIQKKLHIIGDGSLYNKYEENISSNIILYGSLEQREIKKIIEENCAYYISLSFREGLSLSLLESLSSGLIPIVADIPSQQFILKHYGFELIKKDLSNLENLVNYNLSQDEIRIKTEGIKTIYRNNNINNEFKEYWSKY
ncbi:glycosyltransferase [bacterium]|nr:glycosyltransferase [bacterium]